MERAVSELWGVDFSGNLNIPDQPEFAQLRAVCLHDFPDTGSMGMNIALTSALISLGAPCELQPDTAHLSTTAEDAAKALASAFRATHARRLHLAPLDLAHDFPPLSFGPARVGRLEPDELHTLIDADRLKRFFPQTVFDAERFSEFHWLIVEESVRVNKDPSVRAVPALSMNFSQDLGRIEPHKGRLPCPLEDALFFLLLAPWEDWVLYQEIDWRGFRIPWAYTVDHDLFVRPKEPPRPDSLHWDFRTHDDGCGNIVEYETPMDFYICDNATAELATWSEDRWAAVQYVKASAFFKTPIQHFLVRAFLDEGIDEFLAHITTIEAALGLRTDYRGKGSASQKMRQRIANLLNDASWAEKYRELFDIRSAFLHGRSVDEISTQQRIAARSLARRVVDQLIHVVQGADLSRRDAFLEEMGSREII